jgi:hypothetical protein
MTNLDNVIPIGRATLSRARVISSDKPAEGFEELAREVVGTCTFIAERGRVRGKNVWRIRNAGTEEVIDYFEPDLHRETFAALIGTEPAALDDWLSGRAFVRKPTS